MYVNERSELKEALSKGFVSVVFQKSNGDTREMVCTTKASLIPGEDEPSGKGIKTNPDVVRVYEQEVGWRSFKFDSVIDWETEPDAVSNEDVTQLKNELKEQKKYFTDLNESYREELFDVKESLQELMDHVQSLIQEMDHDTNYF